MNMRLNQKGQGDINRDAFYTKFKKGYDMICELEKEEVTKSESQSDIISVSSKAYSISQDRFDQMNDTMQQIIKDIPRTFSNYDIFFYKSILQKLFRVFSAYTKYDSDLEYVQGMNYIAGAMLIHCDEAITFWLLVTLYEQYDVRSVFTNNLAGMHKHMDQLQSQIDQELPKTAMKMMDLDIIPTMFASNWIVSLFCHFIPLEFSHHFLT